MHRKNSIARSLALPENRSAFLAVDDLISRVRAGRVQRLPTPLLVHGPAGSGKSHLVSMLVKKITLEVRDLTVAVLSAGDLQAPHSAEEQETADLLDQAQTCDLWILEDLHHLSLRCVETLVQLLDHRAGRRLPTVITAQAGPRHLARGSEGFPARLTSRLAAGLVVALEPWQTPSRLLFLEELAQRRQFAVASSILAWLAENLPGSGRVLEGALNQLETLARQSRGGVLDLERVRDHFRTETEAHQPTMERIAQQVSGYFRLEPAQLRSRSRFRNILLPRQVSMYLARTLTRLSLDQIGDFFGGRDHTTVLHACRKVQRVLEEDPVLSGAVRQLHAQLA